MDGLVNYLNYDMGNVKIGDSVRKFLTESDLKDSYLAKKINVSRYTIRNWKLGVYKTARQQNLSFLAQELKLELKISSGIAEFQEINIEEIDMAEGLTQDIIKSQLSHIKTLENDIKRLTVENSKLTNIIERFDNEIKNSNIPTLDHNELQIITKVDDFTYHSVSTAYAKMLGYTAIEMLNKDFKWTNIIHEDDYFKITLIKEYFESSNLVPDSKTNPVFCFWKLKTKSGNALFIKSDSTSIGDRYSYVCMSICDESAYNKELEAYLNSK